MKVGIALTASATGGVNSHDSIDYCRWAARFVDQAGFDFIWTTEHHITEIAHTGAPSPILAHYAGITEHAKLGYAVAIVSLHHPLRLTEELLWVDNLSDGRAHWWHQPGLSAAGIAVSDGHRSGLAGAVGLPGVTFAVLGAAAPNTANPHPPGRGGVANGTRARITKWRPA